jgi:hypothetical protein
VAHGVGFFKKRKVSILAVIFALRRPPLDALGV